MKVEFQLSFEDFLETRGELQGMLDGPETPLYIPRVLLILFACVALLTWNWISAAILSSGPLIFVAAIVASNFFRRRGLRLHLATLRADYERFSSGPFTFEADEKGWRCASIREEQVHTWDEVQMVKDHPRILYLMTHSGACTLPKPAFTLDQLAQIKLWYEQAMSPPSPPSGFPEGSSSIILCKFGFMDKSWRQIPHEYPGVWATEKTSGPTRLVIAPANRHVDLLLKLARLMSQPFRLLYILVEPRGTASEGRYESRNVLSREEIALFLNRFGRFLESDGRHHVWIRSIGESDLLVYDNHNLIYAYGCLDRFKEVLKAEGLVQVPEVVIPSPHSYFFHEEFDGQQDQLLSFCNWEHSPLQDEDE